MAIGTTTIGSYVGTSAEQPIGAGADERRLAQSAVAAVPLNGTLGDASVEEELRAAMSLGRLWQAQGKRDAARELLTQVYGWFTEGFDTGDLRGANAMLRALEGEDGHESRCH